MQHHSKNQFIKHKTRNPRKRDPKNIGVTRALTGWFGFSFGLAFVAPAWVTVGCLLVLAWGIVANIRAADYQS